MSRPPGNCRTSCNMADQIDVRQMNMIATGMSKQPGKRALVLMGAGASIEFGAPSTADLTVTVGNRVLANDSLVRNGSAGAWSKIGDTLTLYYQGGEDAVNFEHIFHCAHELLFTFEPLPVDEYRPVLVPFIDRRLDLTRDSLRELVISMPQFIFGELSEASERPATSLDPLTAFIDRLRLEYVTRIYTTNYDDFTLQAVPDLYVGFKRDQTCRAESFNRGAFWQALDRDSVFHLHGSVHLAFGLPQPPDLWSLSWYNDRVEALRNISSTGSNKDRMDGSGTVRTTVVTGLDKLWPLQQQPFSHFYASMAHDAMTADVIFVIGCGLSDLHLNTWLGEARRLDPKPPLIFVDRWRDGFLRYARYTRDRKFREMVHTLLMPMLDDGCDQYGTGWNLDKKRTYAVWEKGFLAFLEAPKELQHVLEELT